MVNQLLGHNKDNYTNC